MDLFLRACICVALLLITVESVWAQSSGRVEKERIIPQEKCISIVFPFNKSIIDSTYMDNAQSLSNLHYIMSDTANISKLDSVVITAHSSPEGSYAYNIRLAQRRADAIKSYILQKYTYIKPEAIKAYPYTDYWQGLVDALTQHPNAPGRNEFLKVVIDTNLTDNAKIHRMMSIQNGEFFNYIRNNNILAHLRQGNSAVRLYTLSREMPLEVAGIPVPKSDFEPLPLEKMLVKDSSPPTKVLTSYPLALRTNLLLCLLGGPNLAVEIPINQHLSVAGGFDFAYTRLNNQYTLQTKQLTLEGRYWLNPGKNPLTGWNIGVYGTYNDRFDLQWKEGWQGDGYWSAGLSAGYSMPLTNRLNMDFSVMGGYFYTPEMRRYTSPQNGHLMWQETRYNVSRIMPTQVRVSIIWLLKKTKKAAQ